jgi:hypothetical protein
MTKSQILAKFGNELSKKDVDELTDKWNTNDGVATYMRSYMDTVAHEEVQEECIIPGYPSNEYSVKRH